MSTTTPTGVVPYALTREEGEPRWFLGALATIKADADSTGGRVAVVELEAEQGFGSPLHVHHAEDEWFYVIEGELTFWVGGTIRPTAAGSFVYGPRDVPHTFVVTSPRARFLIVCEPAGFDRFVRSASEPAEYRALPPEHVQPPSPEELIAIATEHGQEILGPPGIPA